MLWEILGFVLVVLGAISLRTREGKWGMLASITMIAIGCWLILFGLLGFSNPELGELWEVGLRALSLAGGAYVVGRGLLWVITRTDLYQSLMYALRSLPEIKESVKNIEKTVTAGGSSLSKSNPEEEEKKKEEEWPPRGARPLAGLVGGALLGGAVAGPPGAVVGALIGLFLGASAEAEEERRRKEEKRRREEK